MYVKIKCPFISPVEWHPFTISSSPESDWLTVHIRSDPGTNAASTAPGPRPQAL